MKIYKNKFDSFSFRTVYIKDEKEAGTLISQIDNTKLYGLDIETAKDPVFVEQPQAGLCPRLSRIRLLQIYNPEKKVSYVFDLFHVRLETIVPLLTAGRFVAHNALFEIQHLLHRGITKPDVGCSMLLSQLIEGAEHSPFEIDEEDQDDDTNKTGLSIYRKQGHSLDAVTQRLFGIKVSKSQQVSDWGKEILDTEQITYAGLDALLTYECAMLLAPKLKEYKMVKAYKLLKDMQHVIASIQLEGLPVDWDYHQKMITEWNKESEKADARCKPFFGDVNMRSSQQMAEWLKKYLKKDLATLQNWPKTEKGAYTFKKDLIAPFKHLPAIGALLDYKKWSKLIDTYGISLVEKKHPLTGRLHTSYTLGQTRTGRLSSRNPNVQNYPRDKVFRDMFAAEKGHVIVVSDFSQIELRLQAEFSKDPVMCASYKSGGDIYKMMASKLYGIPQNKITKEQRFVGKTVMLALGYGMGANKLGMYAINAGIIQPQSFWVDAHRAYYDLFKVYVKWCDKVRLRAKQLGYIETLLGKRRKLKEDEMYTRAPNTVIQGSAAELMMRAMCICFNRLLPGMKMVGTVHDEILLHVPKNLADKAKDILASSMNDAMKELFPKAVSHHVADAAYGVRWGEVKADL